MYLLQLAVQCVAYRIPTVWWAVTWPLVRCVVVLFHHSLGCEMGEIQYWFKTHSKLCFVPFRQFKTYDNDACWSKHSTTLMSWVWQIQFNAKTKEYIDWTLWMITLFNMISVFTLEVIHITTDLLTGNLKRVHVNL